MAVHDFCGGAVPVIANDVLDGLEASEGREAVVLKSVFYLTHPKAESAVNPSANFGGYSVDQFLTRG